MKNTMRTYNFFIRLGTCEFLLDVNAFSEDEALDIISNEYPQQDGWQYILIG